VSYSIRYATVDLYGPEKEGLELEIEFSMDKDDMPEIEGIYCLNPDADYFVESMLTPKDIVGIADELLSEVNRLDIHKNKRYDSKDYKTWKEDEDT
jgi:hypothetical protein